jgi:translation initiation factor IF-2
MATRATTKTAPKKTSKPTEASSGASKSSAKDSPRRSGPTPSAPAETKPVVKPAPKIPQETVSLIDPVKKPVPTAESIAEDAAKPRRVLPPISKIMAKPAPAPVVAVPAPAPVVEEIAAPAPAVEAAESEAEVVDDKIIHIKPPIIVKDLATHLNVKPFELIKELMAMNIFANINQAIEPDIAAKLCTTRGYVFEKEKREKGAGVHKPVVIVEPPKAPEKPKADELHLRAPIVTFMGHVDHGKTSLMDSIRRSRVAAGEAGGITQHIGAYSVERDGHKITFLDTPGHEAFTAMRARGANVTDIVVLVVAADDGLMPQTLEAINHAKAAKVSIIVAINKIDLVSANVDRVKKQLQEQGLAPEDWGGETIVCPVSATKGTGVPQLLEMIQLQAEVLELKASDQVPARCTVIEAQLEPGRGPTATLIVRMGTLKIGAPFICGNYWGKVKSLIDDQGRPIKEAGPATPVKVLGFSGLPNAGDEFVVMDSEKAAKLLGEERIDALRTQKLAVPARATLENLFQSLSDGQRKRLDIVLKSDVQGSLEALIASLRKIESKKITLEIIHSAVGPISESDIMLATASDAIVVGFNIKVENSAAQAARREGIQIKLYSIIYELLDQIKEAMAGLLDPEIRETVIGHAEVKKVFDLSRGVVAGCQVQDGRISRTARARVLRGKQPIYDGGISTLRRFLDDVKEVRNGLECGIKLGDFNEYEPGDVIECYQLEKVAQKL